MKAFHTSNRAPRNCWRVRLMWNVPVLRVMEYDAPPRVCTMACGLFDDVPCLQPFPKPVLTYVSVCQARTLTHANHEPSMRTERRALECPLVRHAQHEDFFAVNPRHERALHISAARSGHLRNRETSSPMPRRPTRAARVLTVSILAMSVRCTAVRRDLDTSSP